MQNKKIFIPFRTLDDWQHVQYYVEIFKKMKIKFELEEYTKNMNVLSSFLTEKEFMIKVHQDDFEKADESVLQATDISDIDLDYYLYDFTDEELMEVLNKPYEWGEIDRKLAHKRLVDKGYDIKKLNNKKKIQEYVEQLVREHEENEKFVEKEIEKKIIGGLIGFVFN